MGWFSDLFKTKDVVIDSGLPKVSKYPPMPSVKPCKPEKDISEPVYAIVKAMQERPSSFKVRYSTDIQGRLGYPIVTYTCKDLKTNQEVNITAGYGYDVCIHRSSWKWLTKDEISFLVEVYTEIYKNKLERSNSIQRAAMKAIYK